MRHLAIAAALVATAGSAQAATIFGVDGNDNLVRFDSAAPGTFLSSVKISGAVGILGMDFRPLNGVLYALASDQRIYTIDQTTGVATAVSGVLNLGSGNQFAFDFNPTIDRLRIVSNADNNYVFNPNDGSLTTATSVFYVAGDANAGKDPNVTALAYTSSVFGAAAGTTQLYGIDTVQDVLVTQANSLGELRTVGSLGVDVGSRDSFDISGSDAFAIDGQNLYRVNLGTGALTLAGRTPTALFGLAIAPVPEPSTWAMMVLGFGLVGMAVRRRRVRYAAA